MYWVSYFMTNGISRSNNLMWRQQSCTLHIGQQALLLPDVLRLFCYRLYPVVWGVRVVKMSRLTDPARLQKEIEAQKKRAEGERRTAIRVSCSWQGTGCEKSVLKLNEK